MESPRSDLDYNSLRRFLLSVVVVSTLLLHQLTKNRSLSPIKNKVENPFRLPFKIELNFNVNNEMFGENNDKCID